MIDPVRELEARRKDRSLRAFAEEIGVTAPYVHDVLRRRRDPGPAILRYLGLVKVEAPRKIKYVPAGTEGRAA